MRATPPRWSAIARVAAGAALLAAACDGAGTGGPISPGVQTTGADGEIAPLAPDDTFDPTGVVPTSPETTCPLFPQDNFWHADVSDLPVHAESDTFLDAIGPDATLHADFGSGTWEGGPIGIPYTVVDGDQPEVQVAFEYSDESDPGPYPIPPDPPVEGGAHSDGDRHVLVVERDSCTLYELFHAWPEPDGSWSAGSGAIFDLASNQLRPDTWTSADAAGLPVLPGLVRYEEVAAGTIDHALRFTVERTQDRYVWPARHQAGQSGDHLPPMGLWLRLKADVDTARFAPEVQVIVGALQTHGMILADNGSSVFLSGVPDSRWDNDALRQLREIVVDDLEAVDVSSLIVDPDSGQVRP